MLALERQREIVNVVAAQGRARVSELAERFDVTEETIRRDLEKLEADGKLVRSHGGAVPALEKEAPHWQREFVNQAEKEAIARTAARMVNPGERILLDASSTAWFLAQRLADLELTVITNSLHCALVLGEGGKAKVISPGGTLAATSLSFVGSETQQALRRYHGEKLFMSCRGLDLQRGASDISEEQAMVRRVLMEIADQRVLMVDSSKLGVRALSIIASADAFTHIITDDKADPDFCRQLEQMGVIVQRAGL
jgi:DeoR/GlpR family transcriptional regulator of sugar metabolism